MESESKSTDLQTGAREKLASRIFVFSTVALAILGAVIVGGGIYAAVASSKPELVSATSQLVFSALLPLFGTWVGTILAFYFSKENFQAANEATRELLKAAGGQLSEKNIRDAMIPRSGIVAPVVLPSGQLRDVPLSEVEAAFARELASGRRLTRVVMLDSRNVCLGVLHRSIWNEMHRAGLTAATPIDFKTGKLGDVFPLTTDSDPRRTYEQFFAGTTAHVAFNGTLADAKSRMEAIDGCQDVIVTETGSRVEPMLGWITNVEIAKASRA
jgi:hypothetical protein